MLLHELFMHLHQELFCAWAFLISHWVVKSANYMYTSPEWNPGKLVPHFKVSQGFYLTVLAPPNDWTACQASKLKNRSNFAQLHCGPRTFVHGWPTRNVTRWPPATTSRQFCNKALRDLNGYERILLEFRPVLRGAIIQWVHGKIDLGNIRKPLF